MPAPSLPKVGKLSLNEYAINDPILPGQKRILTAVAGNHFYVSEASHSSFRIVLNDKCNLKGRLARGYIFPPDEEIVKIEIRNTHAETPLTLLIEVGRGRPLDEGLNVYTEQITPTVRSENSSAFALIELDCTGTGNPLELVAEDCDRAEIWLFTSTGGTAYWGPTADTAWPLVDGNQVGQTMDGVTKLKTCAPIYVRGDVGTTVYAYVFTYAD